MKKEQDNQWLETYLHIPNVFRDQHVLESEVIHKTIKYLLSDDAFSLYFANHKHHAAFSREFEKNAAGFHEA